MLQMSFGEGGTFSSSSSSFPKTGVDQWVNHMTKFFKRRALFAMNLGNLSEASSETSRMSQKLLTHWHLSATNRNIEKSHTLL